VADEPGEYSLPTAVRSTVVGPGPTHVGPSDEYVDAAASGRVVTSVRASDSISATGTSSSESRGFLSSISRRILPSWFGSDSDRQPDRAVGGPMETSTQFVASSQQVSQPRASRTAFSVAVAPRGAGTPRRSRVPAGQAGPTIGPQIGTSVRPPTGTQLKLPRRTVRAPHRYHCRPIWWTISTTAQHMYRPLCHCSTSLLPVYHK